MISIHQFILGLVHLAATGIILDALASQEVLTQLVELLVDRQNLAAQEDGVVCYDVSRRSRSVSGWAITVDAFYENDN